MSNKHYSASLLDFIEPSSSQEINEIEVNLIKSSPTSFKENVETFIDKTHVEMQESLQQNTQEIEQISDKNLNSKTEKKIKHKSFKSSDNSLMKIGDVAKLFNLNTSVLRFWESTFDELNPVRTSTGQRLYSQQDVIFVKRLKKLLHKDKLTIEGAKKSLYKTPLSKEKAPKPVRNKIQALSLHAKPTTMTHETSSSEKDLAVHIPNNVQQNLVKSASPTLLRRLEKELLDLQKILNK